MKKEFVPYELALKLKNLGYNGVDFGYYRLSFEEENEPFVTTELIFFREKYDNCNYRLDLHRQVKIGGGICTAPLFQQAFRWFREEHNLNISFRHTIFGQWWIQYKDGQSYGDKFDTYEEAELACLDKLIEIVESKQKEQ